MSQTTFWSLVFCACLPFVVSAKPIKSVPLQGVGVPGQVAFWSGGGEISGDDNLLWNNNLKRLGVGVAAPTARVDLATELDAIGLNVYSYFRGVSNSVFGVKSRVYANDGRTDLFSGYFAASSDSSVRNSYGVFGMSKPDGAEQKSVGVHGEGYAGNISIGVEGSGGDIGVLGEAPFGGVAVKAKQIEPAGYAIYAEGGQNYFEGKVQVGSTAKPQGIVLFDHSRKVPVCLRVVDSTIELEDGNCD